MTPASALPFIRPRILLMGDPGVGKTTFVLSGFPRLYMFHGDNKLRGPLNVARKADPAFNCAIDLSYVRQDGTHVPPAAQYDWCFQCLSTACSSPDYEWICLDGLTWLNQAILTKVLSGRATMERSDWIPFQSYACAVLNLLRDSPKAIIVLCHQALEHDRQGNVTSEDPMFSSRLGQILAGWFGNMWQMKAFPASGGKQVRQLYLDRNGLAKLQNDCGAPAQIQDPTWAKVEPFLRQPSEGSASQPAAVPAAP